MLLTDSWKGRRSATPAALFSRLSGSNTSELSDLSSCMHLDTAISLLDMNYSMYQRSCHWWILLSRTRSILIWTSHPTQRKSPATLQRKLILTAGIYNFFCHYPNFLAIGEGRNIERPVNREHLTAKLPFHHNSPQNCTDMFVNLHNIGTWRQCNLNCWSNRLCKVVIIFRQISLSWNVRLLTYLYIHHP